MEASRPRTRIDRLLGLIAAKDESAPRRLAAEQLGEVLAASGPGVLQRELLERLTQTLMSSNWQARTSAAHAIGVFARCVWHPGGGAGPGEASSTRENGLGCAEELRADQQGEQPGRDSTSEGCCPGLLRMVDLDVEGILAHGRPLLADGPSGFDAVLAAASGLPPDKLLERTRVQLLRRIGQQEAPGARQELAKLAKEIVTPRDVVLRQGVKKDERGIEGQDDAGSQGQERATAQASERADSAHELSAREKNRLRRMRRKPPNVVVNLSTRTLGLSGSSAATHTPSAQPEDDHNASSSGSKEAQRGRGEDEACDNGVLRMLSTQLRLGLLSERWYQRHGCAVGLCELLKQVPPSAAVGDSNVPWIDDCACRLIAVVGLEQFVDYSGVQAVAPVAAAAAQALGCLSAALSARQVRDLSHKLGTVARWHGGGGTNSRSWLVRHSALVALQFILAVRLDVLCAETSAEEVDTQVQHALDAAAAALQDSDDDVCAAGADVLSAVLTALPEGARCSLQTWCGAVWTALDRSNDLATAVPALMRLLDHATRRSAHTHTQRGLRRADCLWSQGTKRLGSARAVQELLCRLAQHSLARVRAAAITTLSTSLQTNVTIGGDTIEQSIDAVFNRFVFETEADALVAVHAAWSTCAVVAAESAHEFAPCIQNLLERWMGLCATMYDGAFGEDPIGQRSAIPGSRAATAMGGMLGAILRTADDDVPQRQLRALADDVSSHLLSMGTSARGALVWAAADVLCALATPGVCGVQHGGSDLLSGAIEPFSRLSWMNNDVQMRLTSAFHAMLATCTALLHRGPDSCNDAKEGSCFAEAQEALEGLCSALDAVCKRQRSGDSSPTSDLGGGTWLASVRTAQKLAIDGSPGFSRSLQSTIASACKAFHVSTYNRAFTLRSSLARAVSLCMPLPRAVSAVVNALVDGLHHSQFADVRHDMALALLVFIQRAQAQAAGSKASALVSRILHRVYEPLAIVGSSSSSHDKHRGFAEGSPSHHTPLAPDMISCVRLAADGVQQQPTCGAAEFLVTAAKSLGDGLFASLPELRSMLNLEAQGATGKLCAVRAAAILAEAVAPSPAAEIRVSLLPSIVQLALSVEADDDGNLSAALTDCCAIMGGALGDAALINTLGSTADALDLPGLAVAARERALKLAKALIQRVPARAAPYAPLVLRSTVAGLSHGNVAVRNAASEALSALMKTIPLLPRDAADTVETRLASLPRKWMDRLRDETCIAMALCDGRAPCLAKGDMCSTKLPLREYQREGVAWLRFLRSVGLHGILADDMGLGKTAQALCAVFSSRSSAPKARDAPSLVVCPATLVKHWSAEAAKIVDQEAVVIEYCGAPAQRAVLRAQLASADLVVTSYETLRLDVELLEAVPVRDADAAERRTQGRSWRYLILDEGHIIRNVRSQVSAAVKRVRSTSRLLLTGTPVQNAPTELWALFDFLMPGYLGSSPDFNARFASPIKKSRQVFEQQGVHLPEGEEALKELHRLALPFILRRTKEVVLRELPRKTMQDVISAPSEVQRLMCDVFASSQEAAALEKAARLSQEASQEEQGHLGLSAHPILHVLQFLRKVCNHPRLALADPNSSRFFSQGESNAVISYNGAIEALGAPGSETSLSAAPKLGALKQILDICGIGQSSNSQTWQDYAHGGGTRAVAAHRCLVFAQSPQTLDMIAEELLDSNMPSVTYERIDTSVPSVARAHIAARFNSDPTVDVLLLTTGVGGLGLSLTGADTVVMFDHDWNPCRDAQAIDRAHRLGQTRNVSVFRLLVSGTMEEKVMSLQRFKAHLSDALVGDNSLTRTTTASNYVMEMLEAAREATVEHRPKRARHGDDGTQRAAPFFAEAGVDSVMSLIGGGSAASEAPQTEEYRDFDLRAFLAGLDVVPLGQTHN